MLSDEKRRKEYDEARSLFGDGAPRSRRRQPAAFGFDLGDLLRRRRYGRRYRSRRPDRRPVRRPLRPRPAATQPARRGADIETEVDPDVRRGDRRRHGPAPADQRGSLPDLPRAPAPRPARCPRVCPVCGHRHRRAGTPGGFAFSEPCRECRAAAWSSTTPARPATAAAGPPAPARIQARIPAGVADGQRIRLKGKGAPGERGGPAGDLYVLVHVKPHQVFGRCGDNLTSRCR